MSHTPDPDHDDASHHDGGFTRDIARLLTRRRALGLIGGAAAAGGWMALRPGAGMAEATMTAAGADGSACVGLPEETAGPYPGDGTNMRDGQTVNALADAGIERADIRPDLDGAGAADGVPMTLEIRLVDVAHACQPLAGRAVYLWHCDTMGLYSLYSAPDASYLRGLQIADTDGIVRFQTIFPGCYDGRWPHIHFEVFDSAADATNGRQARLTSQFALPQQTAAAIYAADDRYSASAANLGHAFLTGDMVFRDNSAQQLAAQTPGVAGDSARGLAATVTVGLA